MTEVNIPLLRKAVEWAEAEAAKPFELCEWNQGDVVIAPENVVDWDYSTGVGVRLPAKSAQCGTCYCIAGFVAVTTLDPDEELTEDWHVVRDGRVVAEAIERAAERLGLSQEQSSLLSPDGLFAGSNTIEDVRRIAESIAGERL